jgi:acyl-CoA synthetase (AMP-forming)/AMP-acid ligase II
MFAMFGREFGSSCRFLVEDSAVRIDELQREILSAARQGEAVLLAGASFAFVHLVDELKVSTLALPPGSRVMQTGGYKGKSREVEPDALRSAISAAFGIEAGMIVSEYGMTELSSQAYDGTVRATLGLGSPQGVAGLFFTPPWMRVVAVDPVTLEPVERGAIGIGRIIDLANVDSCVAIQTADRVRCTAEGFELLGRAVSAPARGCSIGVDEILGTG